MNIDYQNRQLQQINTPEFQNEIMREQMSEARYSQEKEDDWDPRVRTTTQFDTLNTETPMQKGSNNSKKFMTARSRSTIQLSEG